MINFLQASLAVLTPLLLLVFPGIGLIDPKSKKRLVEQSARVVLWSVGSTVLFTYVLALLGFSVIWAGIIIILVSAILLWRRIFFLKKQTIWWKFALVASIFTLLFGIISLPFLVWHEGLPTGDSQKAILWANDMIKSNALPTYSLSEYLLNRDPVDFLTPGLHSFLALNNSLSALPLMTVGFMAIAIGLGVVLVTVALARLLLPQMPAIPLIVATMFFLLTNERYLRYLREPGYHIQNLFGEFFLFGLILIVLSILRRWNWRDVVLAVALVFALALTHQFSAFLAVFMLAPLFIVYIAHRIVMSDVKSILAILFPLLAVLLLMTGGFALGLYNKLPHIFTEQPHLLMLTPSVFDYPRLMGLIWILAGLSGLVLLFAHGYFRRFSKPDVMAFVLSTIVLIILSQGPRLGVDIPPVRTMFYLAVPLSICAGFFLISLLTYVNDRAPVPYNRLLLVVLIAAVLVAGSASVASAYQLSHNVRTNSTLTSGQLELIDKLKKAPGVGAVLVDDYNKRSSSWLVLSGRPMYARIGDGLGRQMAEARQSQTRFNLYLKQLDFEKIYSMGSLPELGALLVRHNIDYVVGIDDISSDGFIKNSRLSFLFGADDISIFGKTPLSNRICGRRLNDTIIPWLLRSSTVVNDIGDREDTFDYLPISLATTRLSDPQGDARCTFRESSAPIIPIKINVGNYVGALWNPDSLGTVDSNIDFWVRFAWHTQSLSLKTQSGLEIPLVNDDNPVQIKARDMPVDENGFMTVYVINPTESLIGIDFMAAGLSRTP